MRPTIKESKKETYEVQPLTAKRTKLESVKLSNLTERNFAQPSTNCSRLIPLFEEPTSKSLVVYRLVHPPVTRESGVRLPARECSEVHVRFYASKLFLSPRKG